MLGLGSMLAALRIAKKPYFYDDFVFKSESEQDLKSTDKPATKPKEKKYPYRCDEVEFVHPGETPESDDNHRWILLKQDEKRHKEFVKYWKDYIDNNDYVYVD